jgi:hypothetical protein
LCQRQTLGRVATIPLRPITRHAVAFTPHFTGS